MTLHPSQLAALANISAYAKSRKKSALDTIDNVCKMSNISPSTYEAMIGWIKQHAMVALHFHPDRPTSTMQPVIQALLECGMYKSQFETLLSNGKLSPDPGGARDLWEAQIFGGAYGLEGTTSSHRPKYGALNLMLHPDGPAPRFGSCYFLLHPRVLKRCTFTFLDSHTDPREKGTYEEFDDIMAAFLGDTFYRDYAIGQKDITVPQLVKHLLENLDKTLDNISNQNPGRNLNHYIESQVHGDVSLTDDVLHLVADASFKETPIGQMMRELCGLNKIDLHWHCGFAMKVEDVPSDFRGPTMPSLARRISLNGYIDTSTIGLAATDLKRHPHQWKDRGTEADVLQELKLLWHVLVRYGKSYPSKRDERCT
jgi:hypothetical protein